ncbi:uncharacterized protein [Oscarella lobularis]|uniref:uncharacterized protein n=1 Tax=Oscarella lobularis TaxID=121494 RepID=UPI0033142D39
METTNLFTNAKIPIQGAMFPWRRHRRFPLPSTLLETTKGFKWIGNCNKPVCNKVKTKRATSLTILSVYEYFSISLFFYEPIICWRRFILLEWEQMYLFHLLFKIYVIASRLDRLAMLITSYQQCDGNR